MTSLENAFNLLLRLHSREVTIERPGVLTIVTKITPANYSRNLSAPEDTVIEGREFLIPKVKIDDATVYRPKRGDRIMDQDLGLSVISEVQEIFSFGGSILGYRIRTS